MKRLHISHFELTSSVNGQLYFTENGKATGSAAFYTSDKIAIVLDICRTVGASELHIRVLDESGAMLKEKTTSPFPIDGCDRYTEDLTLGTGLYFIELSLDTVLGRMYVGRKGDAIYLSDGPCELIQLSVCKKPRSKSEYRGGIIYHVFVDRFSRDEDAKVKCGATLVSDWSVIPEFPAYPGAPLKNNTFYGGTLYSAAKRLDYIASLGANIVYLSPIFESPSNHRYDTSDYLSVDKMLGGDEALRYFIDEAKKRGIGVILDGVFNHTGADSIYFNRYGHFDSVGAYQSKESPYYGWYSFKKHPDDYEAWWGIEIVPRINTGNKDFEAFILNKVIPKYRDMGILGLRLDVADELSDEFIKKIKKALGDGCLLYGEVWEDASNKIAYGKRKTYYLGGELDGVMNYPLRDGIIDFLRKRDVCKLSYALREVTGNAPKHVRDMQMNLLGTHDTARIITALVGEDAVGKSNAELSVTRLGSAERVLGIKLVKMAYSILAMLPGLATVFYADEAGLEGYGDPFNRMPYPDKPCKELLEHYRRIGKIRRESSVLTDGDLALIELTSDLLVFARIKASSAVLTVANNGDTPKVIDFEKRTRELITEQRGYKHVVDPRTVAIFATDKSYVTELLKDIGR